MDQMVQNGRKWRISISTRGPEARDRRFDAPPLEQNRAAVSRLSERAFFISVNASL
ncbi:MAG TPA: hypothetical protein VNR41_10290 [Xanthobacteraceae bacterium]|nr:hypothetical protein [Xanthobacteraceae bacterium]